MQFADLHFGEDDSKDKHTRAVQRRILHHERPDLVVLSGDQVSGYAWDGTDGWYARQWDALVAELQELGIPYATVLGNHDDEADLERREILALERHTDAVNVSCTHEGPGNLTGVSNYWLDVLESGGGGEGGDGDEGGRAAARLYFLDSMDRGCREVPGWYAIRGGGCLFHTNGFCSFDCCCRWCVCVCVFNIHQWFMCCVVCLCVF